MKRMISFIMCIVLFLTLTAFDDQSGTATSPQFANLQIYDYSEGAVMEVCEYYEEDEEEPQRYALFKIKYLGTGQYSIRSMLRNDMGWTFSSDSKLVMTNIGASDSGITDATKWCIGYDSNGYYIGV